MLVSLGLKIPEINFHSVSDWVEAKILRTHERLLYVNSRKGNVHLAQLQDQDHFSLKRFSIFSFCSSAFILCTEALMKYAHSKYKFFKGMLNRSIEMAHRKINQCPESMGPIRTWFRFDQSGQSFYKSKLKPFGELRRLLILEYDKFILQLIDNYSLLLLIIRVRICLCRNTIHVEHCNGVPVKHGWDFLTRAALLYTLSTVMYPKLFFSDCQFALTVHWLIKRLW